VATDVRVVLMTAPDLPTAERLGAALVTERLAACANVLPSLTSIYWWEGEVERASEALLILKTVEDRVAALRERAVALHPYDVPELLVLEIREGHEPYLDWVRAETIHRTAEG
jgi:periplasmic divalent cation tolerance protein